MSISSGDLIINVIFQKNVNICLNFENVNSGVPNNDDDEFENPVYDAENDIHSGWDTDVVDDDEPMNEAEIPFNEVEPMEIAESANSIEPMEISDAAALEDETMDED